MVVLSSNDFYNSRFSVMEWVEPNDQNWSVRRENWMTNFSHVESFVKSDLYFGIVS